MPDGVGEEVLNKLFVGSWRGDDPIEKEFFRIIESKISRNGSRKGQDFTAQGIQTVANAFKDITTNKIPGVIGKLTEREGSRKGSSLITSENQFIDYFASLGYDPEYVRNNVLQEFRYEIHSGGLSVEEIDDYLSYAASDILRKGSRKGQDFTADGIKTVANAFKDITTKKIPDAIGKITGERKGTGPLCELGSVSGKGSRPENIGSIASKVALGRKRSINMDGEYEDESRVGSRKGSLKGNSSFDVEEKYGRVVADKLRLADKNYDLFLPDNSVMSKYDVTQEQLDFYRSVMGYQ